MPIYFHSLFLNHIYQGHPTTLTMTLCSLLRSCTVDGGNAILFARPPYNKRKRKTNYPHPLVFRRVLVRNGRGAAQ